ncbi:MAG TPA: transporter [Rhodocyclaceae bacterium]|nr:transporter [Rhodocyclaceae bacterium]
MTSIHVRAAVGLLTIIPAGVASACATCGCSLSSDAAMGYSAAAGWQLNLEYTYIDQDQLRFGTHAVSRAQAAAINDTGGEQEVEGKTTTRFVTLGIGYAPNANWNVKALIPYLDRDHTTYGESGNPLTADEVSGAKFSRLGDVKVIVSYQGFLPTHNLGVQLGVKLPTGDYGGPNADGSGTVGRHPVGFNSGPNAQEPSPGNLLDTSLQPGTGSTDLILGAYYYQPVSQDFDAFINGQFQTAVKEALHQAGADYRPGNLATVSFGLRYEANPTIVPQVQVNMTWKSRDQGALADVANSAGNVVYLSPGVTVSVAKNTEMYGFVQLPVYSNLDGYQLLPHWTVAIGLSHAF